MLKNDQIQRIFKIFCDADPEPKTELNAPNEFCLLVAIILSAQATDAGVNKATPALFEIADDPYKMAALGEEKLKEYIKTIGLFNSKAKNVIAMSKMLCEEYDGKIPETRDELQKLAGVGRKTANVWLNCARGVPTIAVDTHVFRVANRIGLVKTKNPLQTEKALEKKLTKLLPPEMMVHAHHWLILHGRYTCKARKPICTNCRIDNICEYKDKTKGE